ncbi:hypothetical protein HDV00_007626 [Rhizophlyctis rosea]|nr:hypothetical protein HDV00_007626 [Rhizophlyctis rosea]
MEHHSRLPAKGSILDSDSDDSDSSGPVQPPPMKKRQTSDGVAGSTKGSSGIKGKTNAFVPRRASTSGRRTAKKDGRKTSTTDGDIVGVLPPYDQNDEYWLACVRERVHPPIRQKDKVPVFWMERAAMPWQVKKYLAAERRQMEASTRHIVFEQTDEPVFVRVPSLLDEGHPDYVIEAINWQRGDVFKVYQDKAVPWTEEMQGTAGKTVYILNEKLDQNFRRLAAEMRLREL